MNSLHRVLLIEADPLEADRLEYILATSSLSCFQVIRGHHPVDVESLQAADQFDLILLGLEQLDVAALQVLDRLCSFASMTPVIVLTAQDHPGWMISAIRNGAQDCVPREKITAGNLARICIFAVTRHRARRPTTDSSDSSLRTVADFLSAHTAILDGHGQILAVNRAWKNFASANGIPSESSCVGTSYFTACKVLNGVDTGSASAAEAGIREVIAGVRDHFELEYPCHGPEIKRLFHLRVTPFTEPEPRRVVVAHEEISVSIVAENEKNRSEQSFKKCSPWQRADCG